MAIPLLTVLFYDVWPLFPTTFRGYSETLYSTSWQIIQGIVPILVYPAIIGWIGFHCGMRMRNQGQAVLMTLAIIAGWCFLPVMFFRADFFLEREILGPGGFATFSPLIYVIEPARQELLDQTPYWTTRNAWPSNVRPFDEWQMFGMHFGTLIVAWMFLRWRGFATFGRLLKRNDGMPEDSHLPSDRAALTS